MDTRIGAIIVGLAIVVGLLGGTAAYRIMSAPRTGPVEFETVPVVIAARDIAPGETLKRKDLEVAEFPAGNVPQAYSSDPEQFVGQITSAILYAAEPVLEGKLTGQGGSVSEMIPIDQRAVSMPVDGMDGLAGDIQPGDRVDVISTHEKPGGGGVVTSTVLQNVRVLSIIREENGRRRNKQTTVTLLLGLKQAEILATALYHGRLQLALRNPADDQLVEEKKVAARSTRRKKSPAKTPPEPPKIERPIVTIIRGDQVSRELPTNSQDGEAAPSALSPLSTLSSIESVLPRKGD